MPLLEESSNVLLFYLCSANADLLDKYEKAESKYHTLTVYRISVGLTSLPQQKNMRISLILLRDEKGKNRDVMFSWSASNAILGISLKRITYLPETCLMRRRKYVFLFFCPQMYERLVAGQPYTLK